MMDEKLKSDIQYKRRIYRKEECRVIWRENRGIGNLHRDKKRPSKLQEGFKIRKNYAN